MGTQVLAARKHGRQHHTSTTAATTAQPTQSQTVIPPAQKTDPVVACPLPDVLEEQIETETVRVTACVPNETTTPAAEPVAPTTVTQPATPPAEPVTPAATHVETVVQPAPDVTNQDEIVFFDGPVINPALMARAEPWLKGIYTGIAALIPAVLGVAFLYGAVPFFAFGIAVLGYLFAGALITRALGTFTTTLAGSKVLLGITFTVVVGVSLFALVLFGYIFAFCWAISGLVTWLVAAQSLPQQQVRNV